MSDTAAYKEFGNSVAVPVVETLAKVLRKTMTGSESAGAQEVALTDWA